MLYAQICVHTDVYFNIIWKGGRKEAIITITKKKVNKLCIIHTM
jgi:hypothetical protein